MISTCEVLNLQRLTDEVHCRFRKPTLDTQAKCRENRSDGTCNRTTEYEHKNQLGPCRVSRKVLGLWQKIHWKQENVVSMLVLERCALGLPVLDRLKNVWNLRNTSMAGNLLLHNTWCDQWYYTKRSLDFAHTKYWRTPIARSINYLCEKNVWNWEQN